LAPAGIILKNPETLHKNMIKKINKKIVYADGDNVMKVTVEINGRKYWKRYLVVNGKVPKVAKEQLQDLVNDLL
jgi:hypothetical protein